MIKEIMSHFPRQLPKTTDEFNAFCDEIIATYPGIPDDDDTRFAIATMMMHLGPLTTHMSHAYFIKSLYKSFTNEVAFERLEEYKKNAKEKAELKREADKLIAAEHDSETPYAATVQ